MDIGLNDILTMKKPHPCGCNTFKVTRVGMDIKMVCQKCNHEIMAPRKRIEKNIKKIEKSV